MNTAQRLKERTAIREAGFTFTTKTGLEFRLKELDATDAMMSGLIPTQLMLKVANAYEKNSFGDLTPEEYQKFKQTMEAVTRQVVIEPKIVKQDPKADEILITDLHFSELSEIFSAAVKMPKGVANFRQQEGEPTASRPSSQTVQSEAKRPVKNTQ